MPLETILLYEEGEAIGRPPIEATRTIKLISIAPPKPKPKYILEVFVRDKDTDEPIADAIVTIVETGETKTTDEFGGVYFELEENTYTVKVEKEGYETEEIKVDLFEPTSITVYLEKLPVPVVKPPPTPTYLFIGGVVSAVLIGGLIWMTRKRR